MKLNAIWIVPIEENANLMGNVRVTPDTLAKIANYSSLVPPIAPPRKMEFAKQIQLAAVSKGSKGQHANHLAMAILM